MKKFRIILSALFISVLAASCLVDDETDVNYGNGPVVVGFEQPTALVSYFADEGTVRKEYPLQVLGTGDGSLIKNDITVNYEIVIDSTTAVEGVEFDFVSQSGTLTIPAGQSFTMFPLDVNTGNFNLLEPTRLYLKLTGTTSDGAVVSALNQTLAITFVGCLSTIETYTYAMTTTGSNFSYTGMVNLTKVGINQFKTENTGYFGPDAFDEPSPYRGPVAGVSDYGFVFNDVCGTLTIPEQNLLNYYSNMLRGKGSVAANGDITFTYTIDDLNNPYTVTLVKQ